MELFRIDEILRELNMSKEQLAQEIGLSRTNIYNYLSNTNTTITVLNKIAKQVGLPVSELFSRALKSPFSYYIIVDLVKHSFYQVNNLYFKFEPKR